MLKCRRDYEGFYLKYSKQVSEERTIATNTTYDSLRVSLYAD